MSPGKCLNTGRSFIFVKKEFFLWKPEKPEFMWRILKQSKNFDFGIHSMIISCLANSLMIFSLQFLSDYLVLFTRTLNKRRNPKNPPFTFFLRGSVFRSHGGYTPLHIAAQHGHQQVFDLLVQAYKADANLRYQSPPFCVLWIRIRNNSFRIRFRLPDPGSLRPFLRTL